MAKTGSGREKLFNAYSYICKLENRIGDDQIRNRVAGVMLHMALVQYGAEESRKRELGLELSAMKPGFIISALDRGVANISYYLWRFLALAVELGVYDSTTKDAWVAVSTLPIVSGAIVGRVLSSLSPSSSLETLKVP